MTHRVDRDDQALLDKGSALCVMCGLCCDGTLYRGAPLAP